jgi:hypothetical protein
VTRVLEFSNLLSWREDQLIYGCSLQTVLLTLIILPHMPKIATLAMSIFELGFDVVRRLRGIGNTCWPKHGLAQNRIDSSGPHGHHASFTWAWSP